jgi:2-keto-4-pentenoate hydratase/2-oxohepta-3-ene-1,7-dioic acid hydratase in catechol pathway
MSETTSPLADPPAFHLIPVRPSKIIGIGRNYRDHAKELGNGVPTTPLYFLKAPSSLLHDGGTVLLPPESERVDFEGELGVVISKTARRVSTSEALDYVAGYVVTCDVTARDLQNSDGQWSRAKGFDTFCPISSKIVTGIDPTALSLTTTVNGVVRQSSNTSEMVFNVAEIVAHVSAAMTLLPGDLILTGTPAGVGPLASGDRVEVTITSVGTLTFDVAAEQT